MSAPVTATFAVSGMHCASCGMLIDELVEDLVGVVASATSVRRSRTVVTYDPAQSTVVEIAAAIVTAGSYEAELVERQSVIPAPMTTTRKTSPATSTGRTRRRP